MLNEILYALDDFIIDEVFQPVATLIERATNWSKAVPSAVCILVAATILVQPCVTSFGGSTGEALSGSLFGLFIILYGFYAYLLLREECENVSREVSSTSRILGNARVRFREDRSWFPLLGVATVGFLLFFLYSNKDPREQTLMIQALGHLPVAMCGIYFGACRDLPPRKKKRARLKVKEWLAEAFLTPAHTPTRR